MMMAKEKLITEYKATPQEGAPMQPVCDQTAGDGAWHSQRLLRLMAVWVESVGRKLLNVRFGEASRLGVSQPLRQAQEGLYTGRRAGQQWPMPEASLALTSQDRAPWDLIILHLHIIHIQIQADGWPHCCW